MVDNSIVRNLCLCGIHKPFTKDRDRLINYLLQVEYNGDINKFYTLEKYFDIKGKRYTDIFFSDINHDVYIYFLYYYLKHKLTANNFKFSVVSLECANQIKSVLEKYDICSDVRFSKMYDVHLFVDKVNKRKFLKKVYSVKLIN